MPELIKAIDHPGRFYRMNAAFLLGEFGAHARNAAPSLVRLIVEDQDEEVRARALSALPQLPVEVVLPVLEKRLTEGTVAEKLRVLQGLTAFPRDIIVTGTTTIKASPIVGLAVRSLTAPEPAVRDAAARVLVGGFLDEFDLELDPGVARSFLNLLSDPDEGLRSSGMMTVWKMSAVAAPWSRELLAALGDKNSTVRIYAGHTLRDIGAACLLLL